MKTAWVLFMFLCRCKCVLFPFEVVFSIVGIVILLATGFAEKFIVDLRLSYRIRRGDCRCKHGINDPASGYLGAHQICHVCQQEEYRRAFSSRLPWHIELSI